MYVEAECNPWRDFVFLRQPLQSPPFPRKPPRRPVSSPSSTFQDLCHMDQRTSSSQPISRRLFAEICSCLLAAVLADDMTAIGT
jgi:hypothetical protein